MSLHPYRPIDLPVLDVTPGPSAGRMLLDGYRRGTALEFNHIASQLASDPLWNEANHAAGGRSVVQPIRLANLFLLLTLYWSPFRGSHVIEFGSYRGGSALFMARILQEIDPTARVHALDTFEGMPQCDADLDAHHGGDFADADLDGLLQRCSDLGLNNLTPHQGLFQSTFPDLAATGIKFGLAHIDADIYEACSYAAKAVWPSMAPGGYVIFDDATTSSCLGATQAVEDLIEERSLRSEQVFPHFVFRAGLESRQ